MILELDIGNTRTKWRVVTSESCEMWLSGDFNTADIQTGLSQIPFSDIQRVRAVSVVRSASNYLKERVDTECGLVVEFADVQQYSGGLECGYKEPERLGVDRWMALVAANLLRDKNENFAVVDAGSALTVDLCDADGRHHGGYIAPGFNMMKTALGVKTSSVGMHELGKVSLQPGSTTNEAVNNACLTAMLGVINNAVEISSTKHLFLTGGDRELLKPYIGSNIQVSVVPDLVLDGLNVVLP